MTVLTRIHRGDGAWGNRPLPGSIRQDPSKLTYAISTRHTISQTMKRMTLSLLLLAGLITLTCIVAGFIDTSGTSITDPTPPPDVGPGDVSVGNLASPISTGEAAADPHYAGRTSSSRPTAQRSSEAPGQRLPTSGYSTSGRRRSPKKGLQRSMPAWYRDENYTLRTANALWAEKTHLFLPKHVVWPGAVGADAINRLHQRRGWCNHQPLGRGEDRGEDPRLLPRGSIDALTRLVITNAIYFKVLGRPGRPGRRFRMGPVRS